ncbi:dihydroorotase [Pedomonas mirosovicensis]|uniref:dihydroorotase n=1 Tax=Pedomonas mirosovicensis TaxID=2908641 RepID=UPI0021675DFD|nr:dihydroorotase [Pedomonas mirosovicensis]MCH8684894.1 dihydroorotase [Pedomonas mirosovicensis]
MTRIAFLNAHLIDAASGLDATGGLLVENGRIAAVGDITVPEGADVVDCGGKVLTPALIDTRAFKVDVDACVAGGIATTCLMPDQNPVLDDPAVIERAYRLGRKTIKVRPFVAATRGLQGEELAEVGLGLESGAVAIATGRSAITHTGVMLRLLQYATGFDALVITHTEDPGLVKGTCATEGEFAQRLGLPAHPTLAETLMVERDIRLAEATGARVHIAQVTCAASIEAVRLAKKRGVKVTCGVTPAHILLNEIAVSGFRTFARFAPPLRTEADRLAVIEGLRDGTIDVIASGHDPRTQEEKRLPFAQAAPGMVGAETLLATSLTLVHNGTLTLGKLLDKLSGAPARIFGLENGRLGVGAPADLLLLDPGAPWRIEAENLRSVQKNTPFDRMAVQGRVRGLWRDGVDVFSQA